MIFMERLSSVENLLNSVSSLYKRQLGSRADNAPNFNLFQILEVEGMEVSTHSAFLAHLLNPTETHGQGDLFLRQFLLELGHQELVSFGGWLTSKRSEEH